MKYIGMANKSSKTGIEWYLVLDTLSKSVTTRDYWLEKVNDYRQFAGLTSHFLLDTVITRTWPMSSFNMAYFGKATRECRMRARGCKWLKVRGYDMDVAVVGVCDICVRAMITGS